MRIELKMEHLPNQILDFNYQYALSSWIYRQIEREDSDLARWLHNEGYKIGHRRYRLFTFSKLQPKLYEIQNHRLILKEAPTRLLVSFWVPEVCQKFIMGLFHNQKLQLYTMGTRVEFYIKQVRLLPKPIFRPSMQYRCLTPILISRFVESKRYAQYLPPTHEDYSRLLYSNLVNKLLTHQRAGTYHGQSQASSLLSTSVPFAFRLLSPVRSKMICVKNVSLRGYEFDFELTAPSEIHEAGYYAGFGEKNAAAGMGMVKILSST